MTILIGLAVGFCSGLHTSTWGMYKDAPYEGFTWKKYFRSAIVGAVIGLTFVMVTKFDATQAPNIVVLFGLTYVLERLFLEYYKTFLRVQDQSKYFIPMQFSINGVVTQKKRLRFIAAGIYLAIVLGSIVGIYALQKSGWQPSVWILIFTIGSIGGWISAFGGAWKDAPKEGFQIFKFFRSPLIAATYSFMLANLTSNYLYICFGGLGYTIATIETYKTFFFSNRPRGKFAGMSIHFPVYLLKRRYFVPIYVLIWLALIGVMIVAFTGERQGLFQAV